MQIPLNKRYSKIPPFSIFIYKKSQIFLLPK
uniref:Uncharacterized protein n=1 Tax=Rhizophora mucronata TaxID=61149 RepID=A0A2P2NGF5_RHIMU